MSIDQQIADCLGVACTFTSSRGHSDSAGLTTGDADWLNEHSRPSLQQLVDELARTEPLPERTYELRNASIHHRGLQGFGATHHVLLCTDRRVVYGEVDAEAGVRFLVGYPHGILDVENKLVRFRPELRPGPPPVLIWPRIAGDEATLDLGVRHVMAGPSPHLQTLLARIATEPNQVPLVARGSIPPPGWHGDPSGRHEQRWWDGTRWTDHVADAGATSADPL